MARERRRLHLVGDVQGVGFRPWAARVASAAGLAGSVRNAGAGVEIALEGEAAAIDAFLAALRAEAPAGARLDAVHVSLEAARGDAGFAILASRSEPPEVLSVPLDRPLCAACRGELFDPRSRRHRHAFCHCAACGPRAAIATALPWDRARTTLARFEPCARCRAEYEDPADRRHHAESIACPACGPTLRARAPDGSLLDGDPIERAAEALHAGAIVAVLGGGGHHLAVDAAQGEAVDRLRKRKGRPAKPFALLVPDIETARAFAQLDARDEGLLAGPVGAVVVAPRRAAVDALARGIAPGLRDVGLLLPFAPIHWLLLYAPGTVPPDPARFAALVWTSANASGEPTLATRADEAALAAVADLVLDHDRAVARPNDDPVFRSAPRGAIPLRLSRSSAPLTLPLPAGLEAALPILAVGGDIKAAPALARGGHVTLAEHVGDLGSVAASDAWRRRVADLCRLAGIAPAVAVHDLHPDAFGRALAAESAPRTLAVQHHHAHAVAALVEHAHAGPALALVLDGFGYGDDGTAWGGELLAVDLASAERVAHLEPIGLPGGDAAAREPWRMAAAWLARAGRSAPAAWRVRRDPAALAVVLALAARAPRATTSCGRLFDAIGSLLGCGDESSFEGEIAARLEALASDAPETGDAPHVSAAPPREIEVAGLVREAVDGLARAVAPATLARRFHDALADRLAAAVIAHARARSIDAVVLTGGCFQNRLLDERIARRLEANDLRALRHRLLPPGDGALAVGQATIAAARLQGW